MLVSLVLRLLLALFGMAVITTVGCRAMGRSGTSAAGDRGRTSAWRGGLGRYGNPHAPPGTLWFLVATTRAAGVRPAALEGCRLRLRSGRGSALGSRLAVLAGVSSLRRTSLEPV